MFFSRKRYDLTHPFSTSKQSPQPFHTLLPPTYLRLRVAIIRFLDCHPQDLHLTSVLPQTCSRPTFTRSHTFFKMDQIQTHPANAAQAKTFIAPGSLSFPGGAGELTPPSSEADKQNGQRNGQMNGGQQQGAQGQNGNGVTPATPAATPGATQGVSGIVPTLQYVYPLRLSSGT